MVQHMHIIQRHTKGSIQDLTPWFLGVVMVVVVMVVVMVVVVCGCCMVIGHTNEEYTPSAYLVVCDIFKTYWGQLNLWWPFRWIKSGGGCAVRLCGGQAVRRLCGGVRSGDWGGNRYVQTYWYACISTLGSSSYSSMRLDDDIWTSERCVGYPGVWP